MNIKKILLFIPKIAGVVAFVYVLDNLTNIGLWGLLLFFLAYGLYNMYRARAVILSQMKYIESLIFGKPLDRDLWDEGEFKKRDKKTKFVLWNKRGGKNAKL